MPAAPKVTAREKALRIAIGELGVKEHPPGSNSGPRVRQYQAATSLKGTGWPWCMAFVCWCYKQAKHPLPYPSASVGMFLSWARKVGKEVKRPLRGDLVCYRYGSDSWPDHVAFVERVLSVRWKDNVFAGYVRTIEGNTASGNDANGGQVQRRWRWHSRCSYVRI
jgi:hypothetical protein